jgi:release factor glutamine methyltransferase
LISASQLLAASALPHIEARALLAHVLGITRERLIAYPETCVAPEVSARFEALAQRRRSGEPLAYLKGEQEFYGRRFIVSPAVLIPRPDTETLIDVALACLREIRQPRVLELGTGSGCIAITLKLECPEAMITAIDVSADALAVAEANARALGGAIEFRAGHWFEAVGTPVRYDLIVSNPPYVAAGDPHLSALTYEPSFALTDGADGLRCLAEIIDTATNHLNDVGWLVLEHGYDQAAAVGKLVKQAGMRDVAAVRDAAGHARVTRARR